MKQTLTNSAVATLLGAAVLVAMPALADRSMPINEGTDLDGATIVTDSSTKTLGGTKFIDWGAGRGGGSENGPSLEGLKLQAEPETRTGRRYLNWDTGRAGDAENGPALTGLVTAVQSSVEDTK